MEQIKELIEIRDRMTKLFNETNTYEGGYAISTSALFVFIEDLNKVIASKPNKS